MSQENNVRVITTKAVLWFLVGMAVAVAAVRYLRGLGATTALDDSTPWGLWVGFDVLSGVALAAGGFVIAATVYIFRLEKFHALVRPAVLTAMLGYVAVALGLMVDLGRPWNIWRPIFFWQPDSPLFEVAWCVMLYLTVLILEFAPVVFEGLRWQRLLGLVRKLTLALVIAGIGLSTLHQSSLGTLFLLARDRLHPLWYSPLLPLLFFVSAVGLGLMMVTVESSATAWLYRRQPETRLLAGLTRAAAVVLGLYLVLRLGDLAWRSQLHHLLAGTWPVVLFVVEMTLSVAVPITLFTLPALRGKSWAVATGAASGVAGFVLHRADVGGIAHLPATGGSYVPALTEVVISAGLVAAMALIFLFFVERFPVWEEQPQVPNHFTPPIADPVSRTFFGGAWFGRWQLAAVCSISGAVLGAVLLEATHADSLAPRPEPVRQARSTAALRTLRPDGAGSWLARVVDPAQEDASTQGTLVTALLIDGDRQGRQVLFDHEDHKARLGGELSCQRCHHANLRLDRGTPCSTCHADMYRCTDIFDHQLHVEAEHGNEGCVRCHKDPSVTKTRENATPCLECHRDEMGASGIRQSSACTSATWDGANECNDCHPDRAAVRTGTPGEPAMRGYAPGYRWAMHRLCIQCHCVHETASGQAEPLLTRCATCHRGPLVPETGGPASRTVLATAWEDR